MKMFGKHTLDIFETPNTSNTVTDACMDYEIPAV